MMSYKSDLRSIGLIAFSLMIIKWSWEFYRSVRLYGIDRHSIVRLSLIIISVFTLIMELVYEKKGRKLPKVIYLSVIVMAILIGIVGILFLWV